MASQEQLEQPGLGDSFPRVTVQTSDENDVAVPGDWPNNEEFGDRVLSKPPSDVATARQRLADDDGDCYDWWFCLQDLE
ncbi:MULTISPECIES: hypothetical protein [Salinibaculum]|uniref:hypothetical protein n=1 Tax=Salinibaculum TaxID=2732368 RepID=UPI0030CB3B7A